MNSNSQLLESGLTNSVIGSFFDVHRQLGFGYREYIYATLQLFSYLCATNLEVGLLLHVGREPKFHRVVCENRLKHRSA
jgi:hypothetical protein